MQQSIAQLSRPGDTQETVAFCVSWEISEGSVEGWLVRWVA